MVANGNLLVRDKRGMIDTLSIEQLKDNYNTYQVLTMNRHGHETYSFSLIEDLKIVVPDEKHLYEITTINNLDMKRSVICSEKTQLFTTSKRWTGYVNPDKLRKNSIMMDEEDRLNRILSIEKIPYEGQPLYDISVMFTGNFFCNGLLLR
jgi:hypothetical protein